MNPSSTVSVPVEDSLADLYRFIGVEKSVGEIAQNLCIFAKRLKPSVVGALHVTCADEAEQECINAFQRRFVQFLLPPVKFAHQSAFRLANLGGRYEWGAVRVAENHFATPITMIADNFKLLLVKINSHVGVTDGDVGPRLGFLRRYEMDSPCCEALDALLSDSGRQPFTDPLAEALRSEGRDRIEALMDAARVSPQYRSLFAALASSRLQARNAMVDIQDYRTESNTLYVIAPCVTLNRSDRDTEIMCGIYVADHRDNTRAETYRGLGDDPSKYDASLKKDRLNITDDADTTPRRARDHRNDVVDVWKRSRHAPIRGHDKIESIRAQVQQSSHEDSHKSNILLKSLLLILAEVAPIPAAVMCFGHGLVGIHHLYRLHKLARSAEGVTDAKQILDEIHTHVDQLSAERRQQLLELLVKDYS